MGRSFFSRCGASEGRARSATAGSRSHPYPVLRIVPPRGAATPRHVSVRRAALTSPRAYYILEYSSYHNVWKATEIEPVLPISILPHDNISQFT